MTPTTLPDLKQLRFIDWSCLQTHLLWVYEGPVSDKGKHNSFGGSPSRTCWLLRKGSLRIKTDGIATDVKPGNWVFVAPQGRTQDFSDDAEILSVHFQATWPGGEQLFSQNKNLVFPAHQMPELERAAVPLVRLVRKLFPGANDLLLSAPCSLENFLKIQSKIPAWVLAYIDVMLRLSQRINRLEGLDDRVVRAVIETDRFPLDHRYSDREIAQGVGLGAAQLSRLFMQSFGVTARQYFDNRRLEVARRALMHTSVTIKELSFELGFHYESHFCAWFKKHNGVTPTRFREKS